MPQDDNSQLGHNFLIPLNTSAIRQFNSLALPMERRASSPGHPTADVQAALQLVLR